MSPHKTPVPLPVEKPKPLDLSTLLRDAFLSGRGLKDGDKLSDADQIAWMAYDPERMAAFQRISAALCPSPSIEVETVKAASMPDGAGGRLSLAERLKRAAITLDNLSGDHYCEVEPCSEAASLIRTLLDHIATLEDRVARAEEERDAFKWVAEFRAREAAGTLHPSPGGDERD